MSEDAYKPILLIGTESWLKSEPVRLASEKHAKKVRAKIAKAKKLRAAA